MSSDSLNEKLDKKKLKGKPFFALFYIGVFIIVCVGCMGYHFLRHMYDTLPSPKELSNIQPSLVTKVYAKDGSLLHEFSVERRFWVPLEDIPANLRNAVIATEDRRFYDHWGVDVRRILSSIIVNITRGGYAQGASTLTQQLTRNIYFTSEKKLLRKIREILASIQVESYYTKDEILELYLNMVYLGGGVYGVEAASQKYFSKSVKDLTLNECAVIAGCIQVPEHYRPDKEKNQKRIRTRRNIVLRFMARDEFISSNEAKTVTMDSIPSNPQQVTSNKAPYFVEMVRQYLEKKYGEDKLYNSGLSIYTTLDAKAQEKAEVAVVKHLDTLQRKPNKLFLLRTRAHDSLGISLKDYLDNFDKIYNDNKEKYVDLPDSIKYRTLQTSVVALDVKSGAVRVLIGGKDFKKSKFNRAIQARRQPGSAFKPFVFSLALNNGFTPASEVMDQPFTVDTPEGLWRPENYGKKFFGLVDLRTALKKSMNLVTIQVFQELGTSKVINFARSAGLKHSLPRVPALAIGACEVTNMEMTAAYGMFANYGEKYEPYIIDSIVDKHGRTIEKNTPESKHVISAQNAYLMSSMMQSVIRSGTGTPVWRHGFKRVAAGKTGTTDDYTDAWFVGYTPQISCGVWVGTDARRTMGYGVTGGRGAIPIWAPVMNALHEDLPRKGFYAPKGIVTHRICKKSHGVALSHCPSGYDEVFTEGTIPDTCTVHERYNRASDDNIISRFGSETPAKKKPETQKKKKKLMF